MVDPAPNAFKATYSTLIQKHRGDKQPILLPGDVHSKTETKMLTNHDCIPKNVPARNLHDHTPGDAILSRQFEIVASEILSDLVL